MDKPSRAFKTSRCDSPRRRIFTAWARIASVLLILALGWGTAAAAEDNNPYRQTAQKSQGGGGIPSRGNGALSCPSRVQNTSKDAPWRCPDLPSAKGLNLYAELSDITYDDGLYVCTYRYAENGKMATACAYKSSYIVSKMKEIERYLIGDGTKSWYWNLSKLDFNKIFNIVDAQVQGVFASNIQSVTNRVAAHLLKIKNEKGKDTFSTIGKDLQEMRGMIYNNLVAPYVSNDTKFKKRRNFSLFLTGLITLDPDVVRGYNGSDGKIKISQDWLAAGAQANKDKSIAGAISRFWDKTVVGTKKLFGFFKTLVGSGPSEEEKLKADLATPEEISAYTISSWVQIFKLKLWGFFYNIQRRWDIGFDLLSMQLMFVMVVWFVLTSGGRSGVRYLLTQEAAENASVFTMNEQSYMRALMMMLVVSGFFISLGQPKSSTEPPGASAAGIHSQVEMRKNRTLAKFAIRYMMNMGSKTATMFSDLGLSAFLEYLIAKERIRSITDISKTMGRSLLSMPDYYMSKQVLRECVGYFGVNSDDFFRNRIDSMNYNINQQYAQNSEFFRKNNIYALSYDLCVKSYTYSHLVPATVWQAVAQAEKDIYAANKRMSEAVKYVVANSVTLEDSFGWVNVASIPVTYYLIRDNDLFFDESADNGQIEEQAEQYIDASGIKSTINRYEGNSEGSLADTIGSNISGAFGHLNVYAGKATGYVASLASKLMIYNMIPGFSSLQNSIKEYMDQLYTDHLRMKEIKATKEANAEKESKGFLKRLNSIITDSVKKGVKFVASKIPGASIVTGLGNLLLGPFGIRTAILIASFFMAIYLFILALSVFFMVMVALSILIKIVLYFKDLMIHVISSIFLVVWAFASYDHGTMKVKRFMRDTLILQIYPTLIVVGAYMSIFIYEMFRTVFTYLSSITIEQGKSTVALLVAGGGIGTFGRSTAGFFSLNMLASIADLLTPIFGMLLAIYIIKSFPEIVLRKMGLEDSSVITMSKEGEQTMSKGERYANPVL